MSQRKDCINRAFGGAADGYAQTAKLQRVTARNLAGRIGGLSLPVAPRILEIGCGTGFLTEMLRKTLGGAHWTVTDVSPDMLAACRRELGDPADIHFLQMDGEVPTTDGPFDLICANMTFQWFEDLPGSIAGLVSLLSPGGHLAYTTLAKGSLAEWQDAHRACGFIQGTPEFPSVEELNGYWPVGLGGGQVNVIETKRTYPSALTFARAIKGIGAETPAADHKPLSAAALRSVLRYLDQGDDVRMTYQVAYASYQRLS
jgi:malonyl-ACP O-methyltransferase BioC